MVVDYGDSNCTFGVNAGAIRAFRLAVPAEDLEITGVAGISCIPYDSNDTSPTISEVERFSIRSECDRLRDGTPLRRAFYVPYSSLGYGPPALIPLEAIAQQLSTATIMQ